MLLRGCQIFPPSKNNVSRDPQDEIRGLSNDQKVFAPKHAYSGNIFNRNEILRQFLAK